MATAIVLPKEGKYPMTTNRKEAVRKLIIAGAGGFGAEAVWVAEEMNAAASPPWQILGYVDDDLRKEGSTLYGYPVLGSPCPVAAELSGQEIWYHVAIAKTAARQRMVERLEQFGWQAATLVHPSVVRAREVEIGPGTYVGALAVLSPGSSIGQHVIINQRVAVGHDSSIGDFANLCPGAQVNGCCVVGMGATLGSNSSIHQGRSVGQYATVASNSLVIRSVPGGTTVLGIPARAIRAA